MSVWTVDTWKVRGGREDHFLKHCDALGPNKLVLFRDLDEPLLVAREVGESREAGSVEDRNYLQVCSGTDRNRRVRTPHTRHGRGSGLPVASVNGYSLNPQFTCSYASTSSFLGQERPCSLKLRPISVGMVAHG